MTATKTAAPLNAECKMKVKNDLSPGPARFIEGLPRAKAWKADRFKTLIGVNPRLISEPAPAASHSRLFAVTFYATRNPGPGQDLTDLAAAVQLRLRVANDRPISG